MRGALASLSWPVAAVVALAVEVWAWSLIFGDGSTVLGILLIPGGIVVLLVVQRLIGAVAPNDEDAPSRS